MEIDIVYTWVNSSDKAFQEKRARFAKEETGKDLAYRIGESRFKDNNELKYSLRSIERYLPFIRKVFIVHTGAAPNWLKSGCEDLIFVAQEDIIPPQYAPSFQSDVIESFLYKIPDLSEYYIYSNDDVFFCSPHKENDLFDSDGRARVGITPRLAGEGKKASSTFRITERNAAQSLKRHLKNIPTPITVSYKWLPIPIRCLLKECLPFNTIAHVAQPFRKSIWQEFHKVFSEEINTICKHRFRANDGFTINFMAHYYALSIGKAVFDLQTHNDYLGRSDTLERKEEFRRLIFENAEQIKRFCLNDEVVNGEDGWENYVSQMLESLFPKPSRWEI